MSKKYNVFISYSSKEVDVANQVCEYLEEHGISCWFAPRDINPGGNYATQIVHAIRECTILVLLASESTNVSGHVTNEVSLAFDNKKVIIPFKIEDIVFSDEYLYFLGRKHWIEAYRGMEAGFSQLLSTVMNIINSGETTAIVSRQNTSKKNNSFGEESDLGIFKIGLRQSVDSEYTVMSYDDILDSYGNMDSIKDEIISIVNSVLSPENNSSAKSNLSILESISENWRVLLNKKGELVGYWVFVALQNEQFEQAKIGALNESEITLETIEFIDFPGTYKGYLLLTGTRPGARTVTLVQELYKSMAQHFEHLAIRGIFFDEICGVAESPMGVSSLKKLGMKETCTSKTGGKVFTCSFVKMDENRYFASFPLLKKLYHEYFGSEYRELAQQSHRNSE